MVEPDPGNADFVGDRNAGNGELADSGDRSNAQGKTIDSTVSSTVSQRQKNKPETLLSQNLCDSTVSKVVSLDEIKRKRNQKKSETVLSQGGKKRRGKVEPVQKPKAIPGHEWRRQGTGWTLLRSWYQSDGQGGRERKREYVQHYSATALKAAETLREKLS
jgi:hypothetical protein